MTTGLNTGRATLIDSRKMQSLIQERRIHWHVRSSHRSASIFVVPAKAGTQRLCFEA